MITHAFFDPFGAFAADEPPRSDELHARPAFCPAVGSKAVLVTGATGFIGRKVVERLLERGNRVIVHARRAAKAADLFGPRVGVVTDVAQLRAETRVDAIINLAGA